MSAAWSSFVKFFTSLKLTVTLLALSIVLVFWATLAQVKLGVWGVQEHFFRTFIVLVYVKGIPIPAFPGGYFLGGLLFLNLVAGFVYRFKFTLRKAGILLSHFGLILLLLGELFTSLWQEEYQMRLDEGQTRNYSESPRDQELAVIDASNPDFDEVVAIPDTVLAHEESIQHPKLPFRIVPRAFYPNAMLQMRDQVPGAPPAPASRDIGSRIALTPMPVTYAENDRNYASAVIELIGPDGSLGTWLVSSMMPQMQIFDYAGRTWKIGLRFERNYQPFKITLIDFSHDRYPGTDIPKNFSSRIRLQTDDGHTDREVLIYMNNPLRFEGLTFYQQSFANNDKTSILQVVHNPSWKLPYLACVLMALGLLIQFGYHLVSFARRRAA